MARIEITSPLQLNVSYLGDDLQGNGLDWPFRQPQRAVDELYDRYDWCAAVDVTMQVAPVPIGTTAWYQGVNLSGRVPGQRGMALPLKVSPTRPDFLIGRRGRLILRGNPTDWARCPIVPTNGGGCLTMSEGASLYMEGFTLDTANTPQNQDCIDIFDGAVFVFRNMRFGNAGTPPNSGCNHISVADAFVYPDGNYEVSGNAASHIGVGAGGSVNWNSNGDPGLMHYIFMYGNPTFDAGLFEVDKGIAYPFALQVVPGAGESTTYNGRPAYALRTGVIELGYSPLSYLGGTADPLVASGGKIIHSNGTVIG